MTVRIKRLADGVIFTYTKVLANKKGFVAFEDDPTKATQAEPNAELMGDGSLEGLKRNEIYDKILKEYEIAIPGMNRKTEVIKEEAYRIMGEFADVTAENKRKAEAEEAERLAEEEAERKAEEEEEIDE